MNRITLVLALGVSAVAGGLLGATPIGHAAARVVLPAGSVGTVQLKPASVTSAKVKDGTLLRRDFKAGQLPAGQAGPKGDPGPAGSIEKAPAGGALTGSFPNPQLANGSVGAAAIAAEAVTGAKVADRSLRLTDTAVVNGQVHVDLPSIGAQSCVNKAVTVSARNGRDLLVLQPTGNLSSGIVVMPIFGVDDGPWFTIRACNLTGSAIDPPDGAWGYAVYR